MKNLFISLFCKEFIKFIAVTFFLIFFLVVSAKLIYQNYYNDKLLLNGIVLCSQIMNASITYYKEHGFYLDNNKISFNEDYPIDARTNPYFYTFSTYPLSETIRGISVFGTIENKNYEIKISFNKNDEPKTIKDLKAKIIKI